MNKCSYSISKSAVTFINNSHSTEKMTLPYHPLRDNTAAITDQSWAGLIWHSLVNHYAPEHDFTIQRALDLGTGYGHVVRVGHEQFSINVVGVDIRQEIYQGPKDRFIKADSREMGLIPRSSAAILIHHFWE